jgi:lipoprotein-anchoring transpeptidase ErfK/SrfK
MPTLRALSVMYLLSALAFGIAIAFDRDPALEQASRRAVVVALEVARDHVVQPGVTLARRAADGAVAMIFERPKPAPKKPAPPTEWAMTIVRPHPALPVPAEPVLVTPKAVAIVPPVIQVAAEQVPRPADFSAVPEKTPAARGNVDPTELVRVSMRLKENLTREMLRNFSLFVYVSKAASGPWAQHMYVFRKGASGDLAMLYDWPASTGREKDEIAPNGTRQPSFTPRGYYQIDPDRMYKVHYSGQWREPMPHAMFFNWEHDGLQTGLAIHGAVGLEIAQLGTRASAGCIRIAPRNAALLFNLIRAQYKGLAPRFAFDRRTATMSNDGIFMHDAAGNLKMAEGYKVLVFVENYGGANVVAALF